MKHELEAKVLKLLNDEKLEAHTLLKVLNEHPTLNYYYRRPLGGRDNHTLEEHTINALNCFEGNFEGRASIIFRPQHFKLLLAFHDLGKPQAMFEGQFDRQHGYTLEILEDISRDIHFPEQILRPIIAVIDADPIGRYLNSKHNLPLEDSLREIAKMARDISVPISVLWPTLLVYYQCDAAGYKSLRSKVFVTDESGYPVYFDDRSGFRLKDAEEARRFAALEASVKAMVS